MQPDALFYLAKEAKKIGLGTGLHTSGIYPDVIELLIQNGCIDHIALDIKIRWEPYTNRLGNCVNGVKRSLSICQKALSEGRLPDFEVVLTLFPGNETEISDIIRDIDYSVTLVLQQGVVPEISPYSEEELMTIANNIKRTVHIRTKEGGEISYEGNRYRRPAGKR